LPEGDVKTMNFAGGDGSKSKAWKDIWGCGQGIGAVSEVTSVAAYVGRLKREYRDAQLRLLPRAELQAA
jgi:nitronate monooxygenase